MSTRRFWSDADMDIVRSLYPDVSTARIAKQLERKLTAVYELARKLGLHKSKEYLASPDACRLRRGDNIGKACRYLPGHVPANKGLRTGLSPGRMSETQFRPGERSGVAVDLYKPIGTERISKDGYLERKVNDGLPLQRRWRAVHIVIWEEVNGPLPAGHALVFRNGNKADISLDNLELITRADLMRRNTIHRYPAELKDAMRLVGRVKRAIRKRKKEDGEESVRGSEKSFV